ncbi:MAG: YkgJ family cysteine cluster protein [Desulfurococcaceae archaeon]
MNLRNHHDIPAFSCMRCSNCCYFSRTEESPMILPYEVAVLKLLAKKLNVPERLVFEKTESGFYRWVITGYCPFYEPNERLCRIHFDKPLACRMYPFLVNLSTMELSLSKLCKWVNRNPGLTIRAENLENLEYIFPNEMKAVYELLEVLSYASSTGLVVVGVDVNSELKNNDLEVPSPCSLLRTHKCRSTSGLYILFLTGCTADIVEQWLSLRGYNVVFSSEFRVVLDALKTY